MELGIQVIGSYDHVRSVASICEEAGIAAVALADHYLYGSGPDDYAVTPAYDSLVQTAALARDTSTVELVMLVSPVTFRHPAVYAKTLTTIDEIADGRFVFGLGTGWHDDEHAVFGFEYPDRATRFDWLEDALGYLRTYVDDPSDGYEGDRWSLQPVDILPRTRSDLRLLVGGSGARKTPTLVGRYGDEYNLYHHTADGVGERLDVMRGAASDAGRDADGIMVTTCYAMIGGADDAEIDEWLGEYGSTRGLSAAEARQKLEGRIPMLPWDAHAERLAELSDLGFSRTYLQMVGVVDWSVRNALEALT